MGTLGKHWVRKPSTIRKECRTCRAGFYSTLHNKAYCSARCWMNKHLHQLRARYEPKGIPTVNSICVICKLAFTYHGNAHPVTCSKECHKKRKRQSPHTQKPEWKLLHGMRVTLNDRIRLTKGHRSTKSFCPYTPSQLKTHLESKFKPGMSWDNYGLRGWHIDHIRPLASFRFFDDKGNPIESAIQEAMSLDNLQPLWWSENLRKGKKEALHCQ